MAKEKPLGVAAEGAEIEVGITDEENGNTSPLSPSSETHRDNGSDDGRLSYNALIKRVTDAYLAGIDADNPPDPEQTEIDLVNATFREIMMRNAIALKEDKWPIPRTLEPYQIAKIFIRVRHVTLIELEWEDCTEEQRMASRRVGMYVPETGRYTTDVSVIKVLARAYNHTAKDRGLEEVVACIHSELALAGKVVRPNRDPFLVNLKNTNYDIREKKPIPFSPDIVFLSGLNVDYNPDAVNVEIEMPDGKMWDLESALLEWAGNDPEVQLLFWQVIASAARPLVQTDKMVWFYGKTGNNGKGTICQLIRNIVGPGHCGSYAMADYGLDSEHRFNLKGIEHVQANVVDENDDVYLPSLARLRAAVTGDPFMVHVKHEDSYCTRQRGLNLQCINNLPVMKSKGGNMLRRTIVVNFSQCYTGVEREYIKKDYIARPEVLEYAVLKVLQMDFDGFTVPAACKRMLSVFEENNNPVLEFLLAFLPQLKWDFAPKAFLYDLFKSWYREVNPSGHACRQREFWPLVEAACEQHGDELGWHPNGKKERVRNLMSVEEPLAVEYKLEKWTKPKSKASFERIGLPEKPAESYEGLKRDVLHPNDPDGTEPDASDSDGSPRPGESGPVDVDDRAAYASFVEEFRKHDAAEKRGDVDVNGNPIHVPTGPHGWRRAYQQPDGGWVRDSDDNPDSCVTCDASVADEPITYEVWLRHRQVCRYEPQKNPERDFDCDVCGIHYQAPRRARDE